MFIERFRPDKQLTTIDNGICFFQYHRSPPAESLHSQQGRRFNQCFDSVVFHVGVDRLN